MGYSFLNVNADHFVVESASALTTTSNGFVGVFDVVVSGGSLQDVVELITERMELTTGHELTLNLVVCSLLTGRFC